MRRLIDFVKAYWRWLKEAAAVGVFLLGSLVACATIWWFWPCETALRYAGLELEIFGVLTVMWGIRDTQKHFKHPSFVQRAINYIGRRPRWRRDMRVGLATGRARTSGSATVSPFVSPVINATPEQRIAALEQNLKILHGLFTKERAETSLKINGLTDMVNNERAHREKSDYEIREIVTKQETGGLHISATGAVWILFGATMATIPDTILYLLGVSPTGACS